MKICNFCGKSQEEVKVMITSENGEICNECVIVCMGLLINHLKNDAELNFNEDETESNKGDS